MDLHTAARLGDEQAVQALLAAGAAADDGDSGGRLPIHLAALHGHAGVVQLLLEADSATATASDFLGWTPLHNAAWKGHSAVVRLLVEAAPATASAANSVDWTPLHWAALKGHLAVLKVLMEAAPATTFARDGAGRIPLHWAANEGHAAVVRMLVEAAPTTVTAFDDAGYIPLDYTLSKGLKGLLAARCLAQAALEVQPTLGSLLRRGHNTSYLYADLVSRLALTQEEWQSIPAPCPDLASVLPVVMERSMAEAGWLVSRLGQEQRARLRTGALCMNRVVAAIEGSPSLPAELSQRILVTALAHP